MEQILTDTADNGVIENVHLAPIGEYVGSDTDGNPVPEKLTAKALQGLADDLNQRNEEVLADVDHGASRKGLSRDTKAAGWFSRFVVDPIRGLFATLRLTKHGKELLENREYRYISPSFSLNDDGTPVRLHTASLTNTPAFAGFIDPILNQEAEKAEETTKEGKLTMEITKDELVQLIKDTVAGMEKAEETAEEKTEETAENACSEEKPKAEETAENACSDETKNEEPKAEEVKEEIKEETVTEEVKTEEVKEEPKEEVKEEEKEEVIKIEALNAAPAALADVSGKSDWMNLHGDAFWKYLAAHPEIKG